MTVIRNGKTTKLRPPATNDGWKTYQAYSVSA